MASKTLSLTILEREFRINCPDGAEAQLRQAASYLNEKMLEIKNAGNSSGKVLGLDRIAVIAALNITHQLKELERGSGAEQGSLVHMHKLIDEALLQDQQLEL
ncbi:MAG: cell division protein ZapA [Venatoribacter sp.]